MTGVRACAGGGGGGGGAWAGCRPKIHFCLMRTSFKIKSYSQVMDILNQDWAPVLMSRSLALPVWLCKSMHNRK